MARGKLAIEEPRKTYLRCRFSRFGKRHGVHANSANAPSATVSNLVFVRRRRPRKDPSASLRTKIINGMTNRVPNRRHTLPLVDNMRSLAGKGIGRIGLDDVKVGPAIHIGY